MKNTTFILPLIGAVIVFGAWVWDAAITMGTALIVLILLSLYLFFFGTSA